MIRAFDVNREEDLTDFGRLLWQRKISHVIREDGPVKVVAVAKPEQVSQTLQLYREWLNGEVAPSDSDDSSLSDWFSADDTRNGIAAAFLKVPLTITLIAVCITIFIFTYVMDNGRLFSQLLFPAFARGGTLDLTYVVQNMTPVLFARMFTPILLHGSWLHIIFNMLWTWEFGRCIESRQRSWVLALVILFIAFVANWAQYFQQGSNLFVGISGVVAGLMGYIAMWKLIDPRKGISLPSSILIFMLVMIVVMAVIDLDFIADTAHVAGLLAGIALGAIMATCSRLTRKSTARFA